MYWQTEISPSCLVILQNIRIRAFREVYYGSRGMQRCWPLPMATRSQQYTYSDQIGAQAVRDVLLLQTNPLSCVICSKFWHLSSPNFSNVSNSFYESHPISSSTGWSKVQPPFPRQDREFLWKTDQCIFKYSLGAGRGKIGKFSLSLHFITANSGVVFWLLSRAWGIILNKKDCKYLRGNYKTGFGKMRSI